MLNKAARAQAFSHPLLLRSVLVFGLWLCAISAASAHNVAQGDQAFLTGVSGVHPFAFIYLGAKHMVTGYDHLLYLAGVIFFLGQARDIVKYVSLFAIGHSLTLLLGVLGGIYVNPYFIDGIIGLSVAYKALENLGVLKTYTGISLDPKLAVFGFGLAHGFGLSSKLQDLELARDGLIPNMIFFNIGVEIGQIIGLVFLFAAFVALRRARQYSSWARGLNICLFIAGLVLAGLQFTGFFVA